MSDWFGWSLKFPSTTQAAPSSAELADTASFAALAGREALASEAGSLEFAAADRTDPEAQVLGF